MAGCSFFTPYAFGATINASSCSLADVQAATNAASTGDIVEVPAGICTWTSKLNITKGITIQGAGIDNTTIVDATTGTTNDVPFYINVSKPLKFRLTGFTITDTGTTTSYDGVVKVVGNSDQIRIDHIKFYDLNYRGLCFEGNASYGVVDHCEFRNITSGAIFVRPATSVQNTLWETPTSLGGADAVYVEDCLFNNAAARYCAIDGEYGAKYVFRYNTLVNTWVLNHGYEGERSTIRFECYNNTIALNVVPLYSPIAINYRGGTGVVFNNTITDAGGTAAFWKPLVIMDYCSCSSNLYDSVTNPSGVCRHSKCTSYPCPDAVGRTYSQLAAPLYQWNNTYKGASVSTYVHDTCPTETFSVDDALQINRDFYNGGVTYNSATATYTHASSGWTYKPYTHPHPLTLDIPLPPTSLKIIN